MLLHVSQVADSDRAPSRIESVCVHNGLLTWWCAHGDGIFGVGCCGSVGEDVAVWWTAPPWPGWGR